MKAYQSLYKLWRSLDDIDRKKLQKRFKAPLQKRILSMIKADVAERLGPENKTQAAIKEALGGKDSYKSRLEKFYGQEVLPYVGELYRQKRPGKKELDELQNRLFAVQYLIERKRLDLARDQLTKLRKKFDGLKAELAAESLPLYLQWLELHMQVFWREETAKAYPDAFLQELFWPIVQTIKFMGEWSRMPGGKSKGKESEIHSLLQSIKKQQLTLWEASSEPVIQAHRRWQMLRILATYALIEGDPHALPIPESPSILGSDWDEDSILETVIESMGDLEHLHLHALRPYGKESEKLPWLVQREVKLTPSTQRRGLELFLMRRLYELDLRHAALGRAGTPVREALGLSLTKSLAVLKMVPRIEILDFSLRLGINELILLMTELNWQEAHAAQKVLMEKLQAAQRLVQGKIGPAGLKRLAGEIESPPTEHRFSPTGRRRSRVPKRPEEEFGPVLRYLEACEIDLLLVRWAPVMHVRGGFDISFEQEESLSDKLHHFKTNMDPWQKAQYKILEAWRNNPQYEKRQARIQALLDLGHSPTTPIGEALTYWWQYLAEER